MDLKDENNKAKKKEGGEEGDGIPEVVEEDEEEEDKPEDFSQGPIAPKYSLVHSYPQDIGRFVEDGDNKTYAKIPKTLQLKIELPAVEELSSLNCDVKKDSVLLEYFDKYYLSLDFGYIINENEAKAKFISKKKLLKLTLPVIGKIKNQKIEAIGEAESEVAQDENDQTDEQEIPPSTNESNLNLNDILPEATRDEQTEAEKRALQINGEDGVEEVHNFVGKIGQEGVNGDNQLGQDIQKGKIREEIKLYQDDSERDQNNQGTIVEELAQDLPESENDDITQNEDNYSKEVEKVRPKFILTSKISQSSMIFYNINIPGYNQKNVIFMYDNDHLLLRYFDLKQHFYFSFQTDKLKMNEIVSKIELKKITDYITILIEFTDEFAAKQFQEDIRIRRDLGDEEIMSLELLLRSSQVQESKEEQGEGVKDDGELKEKPGLDQGSDDDSEGNDQGDNPAKEQVVTDNEATANKTKEGEEDIEVEQLEDSQDQANKIEVEGQDNKEEILINLDQCGIQLIDFNLLEYACTLD